MRSFQLVVTLLVVVFGASACSISTSLSKSSSSPYEWSSASSESSSDSSSSSSGGGKESAYERDVSDVTLSFAARGGDLDAYRAHLAALAEQRGITAWEEDATTCASIGAGVRRAQLDQLAAVEFGDRLFGHNTVSLDAYMAGYQTVR